MDDSVVFARWPQCALPCGHIGTNHLHLAPDGQPCQHLITQFLGYRLIDLLNSGVSVHVHTSTKSFFSNFDLIWCVGRPRPDMRNIVTLTRSKVNVMGLLTFRKLHFSRSISSTILTWSSKVMVGDDSMGPVYSVSEPDFQISF